MRFLVKNCCDIQEAKCYLQFLWMLRTIDETIQLFWMGLAKVKSMVNISLAIVLVITMEMRQKSIVIWAFIMYIIIEGSHQEKTAGQVGRIG